VLDGMRARGHGRIITISSDAGRTGEGHLAVYSCAKAGAAGLMRALAKAGGRFGITANCIALGGIDTPSARDVLVDDAAMKKMLAHYVIRRIGTPSDAAWMTLFLASRAASWITGQTYPVNGGYSFAL
jgi:3-oxoacyl-[acyl-carrier protein] reductase